MLSDAFGTALDARWALSIPIQDGQFPMYLRIMLRRVPSYVRRVPPGRLRAHD